MFPHFLRAVKQIKPGKLTAFFRWNASINTAKTKQRDWGGMLHCHYFSCGWWPGLFANAWQPQKHINNSLHAPSGGKRILVFHWRSLMLLVPLYNLCIRHIKKKNKGVQECSRSVWERCLSSVMCQGHTKNRLMLIFHDRWPSGKARGCGNTTWHMWDQRNNVLYIWDKTVLSKGRPFEG